MTAIRLTVWFKRYHEIGDCFEYVSVLGDDIGFKALSDIANSNLEKLLDRADRGKLSGSAIKGRIIRKRT